MKKILMWVVGIITIWLVMSVYSYFYSKSHSPAKEPTHYVDLKKEADLLDKKIKLRMEQERRAKEKHRQDSLRKAQKALEDIELYDNKYDVCYEEGLEEGYEEGYEEGLEDGRKE